MADWVSSVPAILDAFYPGQEGGHALTDILFGDVSPSGRLPLTFPKSWKDTPVHDSYPGRKEVAIYKEGIFVGYRYYDRKNSEPLFPFGYGLSYTTFAYSDLKIFPKTISQKDTVQVQLRITNTGKMAGDEVVQLYVHDVKASLPREVKALKGFVRVSLKPGESKWVTFKLNKKHLSFYDPNAKKWIAQPGWFEVLVGSSSRNVRLKGKFLLK